MGTVRSTRVRWRKCSANSAGSSTVSSRRLMINFFDLIFDLLFNSGRGGEPRVIEQVQPRRRERASADNGSAHATAPDARRQTDQQEAPDEEEDEGDKEEEGEHNKEVSAGGDDHLWIPNRRRSSVQLQQRGIQWFEVRKRFIKPSSCLKNVSQVWSREEVKSWFRGVSRLSRP